MRRVRECHWCAAAGRLSGLAVWEEVEEEGEEARVSERVLAEAEGEI